MSRLLGLLLVTGCATAPVRPTKTADSTGPGQRYKNGGGFLSEGGPDFDIGPSNGTVAIALLAVGGLVFAIAMAGDDDDAEPAESPEPPEETPLWARAYPAR